MKNFNYVFTIHVLLIISSFLLLISCNNDPRMSLLEADIKNMTFNPPESDSTANTIKSILSIASYDGFDTDKFQYFTDTTSNEALILVKIPELTNVDESGRETFMSLIDKMSDRDEWKGKEKYIGVFGSRSLMLCKTPEHNYNKTSTPKTFLLDYYGEKQSNN